jgi:hypothetical protein
MRQGRGRFFGRYPVSRILIPPLRLLAGLWMGLCLLGCMLQAGPSPAAGAPTPRQTWLPLVTAGAGWWQPSPGSDWQIQYTGELDLTLDVAIYNLDMFETDSQSVTELRARGIRTMCYINAGAWEDWRPDKDAFPPEVLGNSYLGWPGERWLDIRRVDLLAPIMEARLDLCAQKGFDGVDPDNLAGYTNLTGFPLSYQDQLIYNIWFAEAAHARGLAVGLKNDPDQVGELLPHFDWALTESCFDEGWCQLYQPFIEAGKPVFAVEYTDNGTTLEDFCSQAGALSIDAMLKNRQLGAWRQTCP